ncbi:protein kinase [Streptomyces sp. NPDC058735]|uniref:serine/threonine-protein kinase n=1 Tax=unclassified Streptomyces TaxID=2593676 RepID=UPI0036862B4E
MIGSGGAADVHRGFDLRLRRPVAVKVFRAGTGFDTEEAFRSETVILARLQHPGLVTAYDAAHHDGDAFLVMQLIEGPTLKSRIAEGPLSCTAAAALGAGLADALAHAHESGIVHRDVKPSNILLDPSGRPHLTDFGISRLLDATTRTATGTLTGTAAYLSPEQVLGRPVGPPADIYALGLVLLESLSGRLEYGGGPLEAAIARLHRPPALPDFLPDDFAALLRGMTSLQEGDRPTAGACAHALSRLAGTSARRPDTSVARPAFHVVPATTAEHADSTHRSWSPAAKGPLASGVPSVLRTRASRSASVRGRLRTHGAAAALAAVVAAGLVAADGFSPHDDAGEAVPAPSAPRPAVPSPSQDTAVHQGDTPSASTTPPSRSPSVQVPNVTAGAPTAQPARPRGDERTADSAAGKGRRKTPDQAHGQARKKQHGKKTKHMVSRGKEAPERR